MLAPDEHGVAAPVHQTGLGLHVEQDVVDDLLGPWLGGDDLLHGAPTLFELGLGQVGHALGFDLEPCVDLRGAGELLVDVAGFVAQVEYDAVGDGLVELVGVDERAECLDAGGLIGLEQWGAGEADEHRLRQQRLHRGVHRAGLGAVGFVDEDENIALGLEVLWDRSPHLFDELGGRRIVFGIAVGGAELVHQ